MKWLNANKNKMYCKTPCVVPDIILRCPLSDDL